MSRLKTGVLAVSVLAGACLFPPAASAQAPQVKADDDILTTLNTRYQNTVADCDGKNAFYCSGILISVDATWTDGDSSDDSASFSYLRQDIGTKHLFFDWIGGFGAGYIFKDLSSAVADGTAMDSYCAYPFNADTANRSDSTLGPGCGTTVGDTFYNSCEEAGVETLDDFIAYYNRDDVQENTTSGQCAFDANDTSDVNVFIKAHDAVVSDNPDYWNEVVLKGWYWSQGQIPPIEAFFYTYGDDVAKSKSEAQRSDFEAQTGIHVPVVGLDMVNSFDAPFVAAD